MFTACGILHTRCRRPVAWQPPLPGYRTQSNAPEDGRNHGPKHVEMTGIINKPLLLHLVGCLCYLPVSYSVFFKFMNRVDQSVYYEVKNGSSWESRFYFRGRHRLSLSVCPDGPWGQTSILSNRSRKLFARKFDGKLNNQIHLISNTKNKFTPYI